MTSWSKARCIREQVEVLEQLNSDTAALISGQHEHPLRVIMFNPETNRAEDVSHAIAQEILRRPGLEDQDVPSVLGAMRDFR